MKNFFNLKKLALTIILMNSWSSSNAMLKKVESFNLNQMLFDNVLEKIVTTKPQKLVKKGANFEIVLAYADFNNTTNPLILKALVIEKYGTNDQILRLYDLNKQACDHLTRPTQHWLHTYLENMGSDLVQNLLKIKFVIADQTHPNYLFNYKNSPLFVEITHDFQEQVNSIESLLNKDRVNSETKEKIDIF